MKQPSIETPRSGSPAWTRRTFLQTGGVAAALATMGLPRHLSANPADAVKHLIFLNAEDLPEGPLAEWTNGGSLGGVFASGEDSRPRVETVAGRKAVVFDGKGWLRSSFPLPELLSGSRPFTVMLWMFTPRPSHHATMFTLGSRPQVCAEFNNNFGGSLSAAAFNGFGPALLGHRSGQPAGGTWHHIAYCYAGGENGAFHLYLNGDPSNEKAVTLRSAAGQPLFLGSGFDTNHERPHHPFTGAIAGLQVLDRPLSAREVRNAIGIFTAFSPDPEDHAIITDKQVTMRWRLGREGASPALLLATSEAEIAQATPQPAERVRVDAASGMCEFGPVPVNIGDRFFWRVDQLLGDRRDTGAVWRFQGSTGPASSPQPRHEVTGVSQTLAQLQWQPGPHATAQAVFFGDDADAVAKSTRPLAKLDAKTGHIEIKQALDQGKAYYWRVATENGNRPGDPGAVWSFRTGDAPIKNDITFIVATDQHYGRDNNVELNHVVVGQINSLAGTLYPENFEKGFVRTPVGVIAPGDLLDKGYDPATAQHRWDQWVADYGLNGNDGYLAFPVYEGIGNHDGGPERSIPRAMIRERNKQRKGLTEISENGLHFSWDWEHVHFVNTNLFPGDGPEDVMNVNPKEHDPEMALDFLKKDLAKHVGDSGKPVIVITHYGILGGMSDWWTPESKERFHQAIANYNVIGIFNGHSHGADFIPWKDILTVHCGTTARPEYGHGDFMVVHVTETEMKVIHRKPDSWGISRVVPIKTPAALKA